MQHLEDLEEKLELSATCRADIRALLQHCACEKEKLCFYNLNPTAVKRQLQISLRTSVTFALRTAPLTLSLHVPAAADENGVMNAGAAAVEAAVCTSAMPTKLTDLSRLPPPASAANRFFASSFQLSHAWFLASGSRNSDKAFRFIAPAHPFLDIHWMN